MSRIEVVFLERALEIGLAETLASTLRDIDATIESLSGQPQSRYRARLLEQKASLRSPSLRTSAALVVAVCAKDPGLTTHIRRAFADLAEQHPEFRWFYAQLPPEISAAEAVRQAS